MKGQGAIEVFSRADLNLDHESLDFIEMLASEAALAIDRARTLDRFEKHRPRVATKTQSLHRS
jgi:hypothetical protein